MKKIKLDDYEKEILNAYEKGEMKSIVTSESDLEKYRSSARETFIKDRRASLGYAFFLTDQKKSKSFQ